MPIITEKGMILGYGIQHEDFTWAVRQEPGVVGAFEKVYENEDLIVSFDSVGMSFPNRTDIDSNNPWPHQDQNPEKPNFRCLQGLVNLLPNGPDDGGLIVCKGAHRVSKEFHRDFKDDPEKIWAWCVALFLLVLSPWIHSIHPPTDPFHRSRWKGSLLTMMFTHRTHEWYGFTKKGLKWFEDRGFTWEKVCAEPGDLIVWDSRTPHYNLSPTGTTPRFCIYTCYLPVAEVSQEDLIRKKAAFESKSILIKKVP